MLSFSEIENLNCPKLVTKIGDQTKMIKYDFRKFQKKTITFGVSMREKKLVTSFSHRLKKAHLFIIDHQEQL